MNWRERKLKSVQMVVSPTNNNRKISEGIEMSNYSPVDFSLPIVPFSAPMMQGNRRERGREEGKRMDGCLAQIDILQMQCARWKKHQNSKTIMRNDKRTTPPPSPSSAAAAAVPAEAALLSPPCLEEGDRSFVDRDYRLNKFVVTH